MRKIKRKRPPSISSPGALAKRRAVTRDCGECAACDRDPTCGWRQGLLSKIHRPDLWGMRLCGKVIPTTTRQDGTLLPSMRVFAFVEVIEDVRFAESVRQVLSSVALQLPILVVDAAGRVASVLGPADVADAVIERLGGSPSKIQTTDTGEVVFDHIPGDPL